MQSIIREFSLASRCDWANGCANVILRFERLLRYSFTSCRYSLSWLVVREAKLPVRASEFNVHLEHANSQLALHNVNLESRDELHSTDRSDFAETSVLSVYLPCPFSMYAYVVA